MREQKNGRRVSAYQLTEKGVLALEHGAEMRNDGTGSHDTERAFRALDDTTYDGIFNALYAGLDGWLRACPTDDQVTYLKWKFTSGKWAGHYVMYRQDDLNHRIALLCLFIKVWEVRQGERKPTKDNYYTG